MAKHEPHIHNAHWMLPPNSLHYSPSLTALHLSHPSNSGMMQLAVEGVVDKQVLSLESALAKPAHVQRSIVSARKALSLWLSVACGGQGRGVFSRSCSGDVFVG